MEDWAAKWVRHGNSNTQNSRRTIQLGKKEKSSYLKDIDESIWLYYCMSSTNWAEVGFLSQIPWWMGELLHNFPFRDNHSRTWRDELFEEGLGINR